MKRKIKFLWLLLALQLSPIVGICQNDGDLNKPPAQVKGNNSVDESGSGGYSFDYDEPTFIAPVPLNSNDTVNMTFIVVNKRKKYVLVGDYEDNSFIPCIEQDVQGAIEIPSMVNGYTIVGINDNAFSGCTGLTSVTIPSSVTSIGGGAFYYCTGLTSVVIPDGVTSIDDHAFEGCTGLTSVVIPDGVTSIGEEAFSGCTGLTSVTIPNSVTTIGYHAFLDCDSLTSVYIDDLFAWCNNYLGSEILYRNNLGKKLYVNGEEVTELIIPDGVTSIGDYAFSHCTSLTSVTIPSSVTNIGIHAFSGCTGLTSVVIPDGVTSIDVWAFSGCTGLTSVTIPSSVTSIDDDAFQYCTGLTSIYINDISAWCNNSKNVGNKILRCNNLGKKLYVNGEEVTELIIPDGVTSIGDHAFEGCTGLTSVVIPDGVTSIGEEAFYCCTGLTSVVIPDGVTSIGDGAFKGCSGLPIEDNCRYAGSCLIEAIDKTITTCTIREGTRYIGPSAFSSCKGLTSVVIPDGVTSIGSKAFSGCTSLLSIIIPSSVTSFGESAFYGCSSLPIEDNCRYAGSYLIEVLDHTITTFTIKEGTTVIGSSAFKNCKYLTSVTIPSSVTSIGDYAFSWCTGLTSVTIPNSVTSIGDHAFYYCTGLTSVTTPINLKSIGESAFYRCDSLTSVFIDDLSTWCNVGGIILQCNKLDKKLYVNGEEVTELVIPDGVTSIGDGAFLDCTGLTSVTIPSSVTSIGDYAFSWCTGLTSVTIPDGVTSIGHYAFSNCTGLTSITIPSSVTSIGDDYYYVGHAFYHCTSLTSIFIDDLSAWCNNSENVGGIILGCNNLGKKLYVNGEEVTELIIPDGVTSIGDYAFCHCKGLTSVTIPISLKSIGESAFKGCDSLTSVFIDDLPAWCNNSESVGGIILGCNNLGKKLYVNGEEVTELVIPDGVTSIGDGAFKYCKGLTSITIPSSVTSIGEEAFSDCTGLTSVVIPDGVTSIGDGAFKYCKGLTSVTIPSSVTSIGDDYYYVGHAFYHCTSLTSIFIDDLSAWCNNSENVGGIILGCNNLGKKLYVNGEEVTELIIPDGVTSIGDGAFKYCKGLTSVTIPSSVTSIGEEAFSGCTGLTSVTIPSSVKSIGESAFKGCDSLTSVTSFIQKPFTIWYCFDNNIFENATLYVPANSIELYRNTEGWSKFKNIQPIGNVIKIQVINDENTDLTDRVSIVWYDGDGKQIGKGKSLYGIEKDAKLYYSIMLDEELGRIYREIKMCPAEMEEDTIVYQIQRIERVALHGMVMADGLPAAKAEVKVRQWLNGKYEYSDSVNTDAQGVFTLQVYNDSTEVIVSYDGFIDSRIVKRSLGEEANLGVIFMEHVHGKVLVPDFTYQAAVREDTAPTVQNFYQDMQNVSYAIYNDTQQKKVEQFTVQQNGDIVITDGVNDDDELTITATSMNGKFAEVSVTVTFEESDTVHVALPLVELGGMYVQYESSADDQLLALVYDASGMLVSRATFSTRYVSFTGLEAGAYSIVTMGYDGTIGGVSTLSGLAALGLAEDVDYALAEVTVRDGFLSTVTVGTVPEWEDAKVNYMAGNTSYLPNKSQMSFGVGYVTMAVRVDFSEEYLAAVSDARLVVNLPHGCELISGSVVIDNKMMPYTLDDYTLTVPLTMDALNARVRFCLTPSTYGTFTSTAYVEFAAYQDEHTLPIGTAVFDVSRPEIFVPSETVVTTIPVRGIALPKAEIDVYDNGYLVGSTKALADGSWRMDCELYKPYNMTLHSLHAKITATNGLASTTNAKECYYEKTLVKAKNVTMTFYNGWLKQNVSVIFDFETGVTSSNSYQFYTATDFTFVADLTHNDTTYVKGVTFYVQTSDKGVKKLKGFFDEKLGRWVAVERFESNSLPTNLNIKIDEAYTTCLADHNEIDDNINEQEESLDQAKAELTNLDVIYDKEEEGESSAYERLLALLERGSYSEAEYQALVDEIRRLPLPSDDDAIDESQLEKEYERLMEEYNDFISKYGKDSVYAALGINASLNGVEWPASFYTGVIKNSTETRTYSMEKLSSINETELVAQGYSIIPTTDGSKIYCLESETEVVYIDGKTNMKYRLVIVKDANGKKKVSFDLPTILSIYPQIAPFIMLRDLITEMVNHDGYDQEMLQWQIDQINNTISSVEEVYKKFLSWKDNAIVNWFDNYFTTCNLLADGLELSKIRYAREFDKLANTVVGTPDVATVQKMAELILKEQACEKSAKLCRNNLEKVTTAYEWVRSYIKQLPSTPAISFNKGMKLSGQLALGGFGLFYELIDMYSDLRNARDNYLNWIDLLNAVDHKVKECPISKALALQQQIRGDARDLVHNYDRIFTAEIQAMELDAISLIAAIAGAVSGPGAALAESDALVLDIASGIYGVYSEMSKTFSINGKFKRLAEYYKKEILKIRCGLPDPPSPPTPIQPDPEDEEEEEYWILYIFKYIYPIHDPSGYVYEAVPSNRMEGVTASIYYDDNGPQLWDAADFSQVNPIVTDETGLYAWDVPQGMWQVRYEKEGYETQQTDWLPVPPPQLEINIPMQQAIAPIVTNARGAESGIWLTFSKYMKPETLTKSGRVSATCNGKTVKGELEMLDLEEDPYNKHEYASKVKFVPSVAFNTTDEVIITVKKEVESYASMPMEEDFVQRVVIEPEIKEIVCDSLIVVDYQNAATIEITVAPASASKGKVLHVESTSPMIASVDRTEVTLDDEGKAHITVSGNLPGGAALLLSLPEAELTVAPQVQVVIHENVVRKPKASKRTGSVVEEGFLLTLTSATPGAIIYYTTDGSCPCDEQTRLRYDAPIVINTDMTINAIAVREGMEDSEVATFTYKVGDPLDVSLAEANMDIDIEYENGAFIITSAEGARCHVYDLAGQLVARKLRIARRERMPFSRKGTYVVNVETVDGVTYAKKVVVR